MTILAPSRSARDAVASTSSTLTYGSQCGDASFRRRLAMPPRPTPPRDTTVGPSFLRTIEQAKTGRSSHRFHILDHLLEDRSPMTSNPIASAATEYRDRFLVLVSELRPELHRYCARMTGSIIDG